MNDTVSPWSSKDLWRYCFIKLISYFEPLKDTIGKVKYQLSNWVFNDVAFLSAFSCLDNSFNCLSLYFSGVPFFSLNLSRSFWILLTYASKNSIILAYLILLIDSAFNDMLRIVLINWSINL